MAGKYTGVGTHILHQTESALYTHCASHGLNLCVASAYQLQHVKNMMESVTKIGNIFNSPKRQSLLQEMIKKYLPDNRHSKLINVCKTTWAVAKLDQTEWSCYLLFEEILQWCRNGGRDAAHIKFSKTTLYIAR